MSLVGVNMTHIISTQQHLFHPLSHVGEAFITCWVGRTACASKQSPRGHKGGLTWALSTILNKAISEENHSSWVCFKAWPESPKLAHIKGGGLSFPWIWVGSWEAWPKGYSRGDNMWFPKLGHKRPRGCHLFFTGISTHEPESPCQKSNNPAAAMLWVSSDHMENICARVPVDRTT